MIEDKRSSEERRFGTGTRSGKERRNPPSEDWKFVEKRVHDDRRQEQRRRVPDRRKQGE